jgi:2-C-methyl-D-erythritol 2,4-cyclodiphosphate synthase
MQIIQDDGYSIVNIDATIIAEKPRISAYAKKIEKSLSEILDINISSVNIKSKSNDFMGYIGRNEGIKAHVSLLIEKK